MPPAAAAPERPGPDRLELRTGEPGRPIPADFLGFSFEAARIADADRAFFAVGSESMVPFIRALGSQGVLRTGGNSSDLATVAKTAPAIDAFGRFVEATGWRVIYGLGLAALPIGQARREALLVHERLGPMLLAFQIGNEPDLYPRLRRRPPAWGLAEFYTEWAARAQAILTRVPDARFAGPDTAADVEWLRRFAGTGDSRVAMLTHHHYPLGPPESPRANVRNLLRQPDEALQTSVATMRDVAAVARLPYRMTETNSCSGGGKVGVSDTMASAVWAMRLMQELARAGYAGVNFHSGPRSWYSPLVADAAGRFLAQPLYHAMRLFARGARGNWVGSTLQTRAPQLSAAASADGQAVCVTLVNASDTRPVRLGLDVDRDVQPQDVHRLSASSVDSAAVKLERRAPTGELDETPYPDADLVATSPRTLTVTVPPASITVLELQLRG